MFLDRTEAGKKLAQELEKYSENDSVIIGIPRGGIIVAAEVAKTLKAPLDVIIPRKLGSPINSEVAIGAVCEDGTVIKDEEVMKVLGIDNDYIRETALKEIEEIKKRNQIYHNNNEEIEYKNRNIILVDDGIATGYTVMAALKSIHNVKPKSVLLAVPVASLDALEQLRKYVDNILCMEAPAEFSSVGQFYQNFEEVSHEEVVSLLKIFKRNTCEV